MKKLILTSALAIAILLPFSCKKKEETPQATNSNTTTTTGGTTTGGSTTGAPGSFTWTENGGPVITADSAYWTTYSTGTGIRASKGGFANYFEINWSGNNNTSVATKTLAVGDVTFIKGSNTYGNATTQNLSITAFSNNQLSGGFSVAVTGGSITTLVGGFTSIIKK
jgi:hypothetical protein